MLNKKDLQIIQADPSKIRSLFGGLKDEVTNTINSWFNKPELRPPTSTFEDYKSLTKEDQFNRITQIDWPDGLHACQIGQLKLNQLLRTTKRHWRAIRLSKDKENIKLNLNIEEIRSRMESFLDHFFHVYVYAEHHKATDTFMFSISIAEKNKKKYQFDHMRFGYMIYFPETDLVITQARIWTKTYDRYFKEALLDTFNADILTSELIQVTSLKNIKELYLYKVNNGVLNTVGDDEKEVNPLDIRQKRKNDEAFDYVKSGEQKRRIVPVDMDALERKYNMMKESRDWGEVKHQRVVNIDLNLPLDINEPLADHRYDDEIIEMSITMEGLNVAEGIKDCIYTNIIESPAPLWLETIGISGASKLKVTTEGVSVIEDESEF